MPDYKLLGDLAKSAIASTPSSINDLSKSTPMTLGEMGGVEGVARYPVNFGTLDNEDIYGRSQTAGAKWANGFTKFLATTGTTFLEGTVGLALGVGQAISDGKFSSLYDNDFNRGLDKWKEGLENALPNYYTNQERNAKWYSTDTWATANFGSDLILKNAGFAVGAFLAGGAWAKGLGLVTKLAVGGDIIGAGGKVAQAAQRAEQTILLGRDAANLAKYEQVALEAISTKYSNINRSLTFGANAARAGVASISEAGMEARHAKKAYVDTMVQNYTDRNGYAPSDKEMDKIAKLADDVGNTTFNANAALLTVTNYIQFPKLAGKFWAGERSTLNSVERGVGRMGIANAEGKIISRSATRALAPGEQYVGLKATTAIGAQLERTAVGRVLNRISPYSRILVSPSEGFEEGAQEVISRSATDFYADAYKGKDTDFYKSFKSGIKSTLTDKDGQLAIFSGLLTGGLMENIASPLMGGRFLHSVKQRNSLVRTAQQFANTLNTNTLGNYVSEMNTSIKRSAVIEGSREQAVKNDDRLSYEDAETDAALNYLLPRVQYGRTDLVQADIDAQKSLASTEEGFLDLKAKNMVPQDISQQQYLDNLNSLESKLNTVDAQFENLNMRYGTLLNEDGTKKYNMPHLLRMAYTASKIDDYNSRIPSLYKNFNDNGIAIMDLAQQTLNRDVTPEEIDTSLNSLKQEINDKVSDPELRQDMLLEASDIVEMTYRRNQQVLEYERLRDQPEATPEHSLDLEEDVDPLADLPPSEGITPEQDDQLRELASKETNGEEQLTEEDQAIISQNQEIYDRYKNEIIDKRPKPKSTFYNENRDTDFFMDQGGELVQGKLEYNPTTDRLSFNGREVTNQDINDGILSSDKGISDSLNYLQAEDVRTIPLQSKRVVEILNDTLTQAKNRQQEVQGKLSAHQQSLSEANEQITQAENEYRQKQKGVKNSAITRISISVLQRLTNARNDIMSEMEQLEVENNDLTNLISQYQTILDTPPQDMQSTVSLLRKSISEAEDLVLSNGIINNKLSDTLDTLSKSISKIKELLINRLTAYVKLTPGDFVAQQALNSILESPENGVSPNFFAITKMLTGLDIAPAQIREQQLRNELDNISSKLQDLEQSIRAKQTALEQIESIQPMILNRISIVENATPIVEEEYETLVENTPTESTEELTPTTEGIVEYENTEKKSVDQVYSATAMPPESQKSTDQNYKKWAYFLSKFRLFTDKSSYKTIFVTKNNEAAIFGSVGYIDQLYRDNDGNPYYKGDEAINGADPAVAVVMVKEVVDEAGATTLHFVDKLGRPLSEVGQNQGLEEVVGWKMPSTMKTYRDSQQTRAYQNNKNSGLTIEQELEEKSKEWKKERATILSKTTIPNPRPFTVSKGSITRGNMSETVRNDISGTLVNAVDITKKGLLYIVRKANQVIQGLSYKKGSVVVSGKDFSERALVRPLSSEETDNIFNLLKWMVQNQPSGEAILAPVQKYLQGLFYVGDTQSKANFKFGEAYSYFSILGEEHEMSESYLDNNKKEITDQILALNTNVNANILEENDKFNEYHIDNSGKIQFTEWSNYQEYVLSTKDDRNPLIKVNVVNGDESNPTFKDKYVIVQPYSQPRKNRSETNSKKAEELLEETVLFSEPDTVVIAPANKNKSTTTKRVVKSIAKVSTKGTYSGTVYNVITKKYETLPTPITYDFIAQVKKGDKVTLNSLGKDVAIRTEFQDEIGAIVQGDVLVVRDNKSKKIYVIPKNKVKAATTSSENVADEAILSSDDVMDQPSAIVETEVLAPATKVIEVVTPESVITKIKPRPKSTTAPKTSTEESVSQIVVENATEVPVPKIVNTPTKTKVPTPDFRVGQKATVEGRTYQITSVPKYGGFWIGEVLESGEVSTEAKDLVHISTKSKNGVFYKAFLAEQGIIESTTGPTISTKC